MTYSLFRGSFACLAEVRFHGKPVPVCIIVSLLYGSNQSFQCVRLCRMGLCCGSGSYLYCVVSKTRTGTKWSEKFGTGGVAPFSFRGSVLHVYLGIGAFSQQQSATKPQTDPDHKTIAGMPASAGTADLLPYYTITTFHGKRMWH